MSKKHTETNIKQKRCVRKQCTGVMIPVCSKYVPHYGIAINTVLVPEWECCKCKKVIHRNNDYTPPQYPRKQPPWKIIYCKPSSHKNLKRQELKGHESKRNTRTTSK